VNNKFECIPRGLGTKRKKFSPDFTITVMRIYGVLIIVEVDENQHLGY